MAEILDSYDIDHCVAIADNLARFFVDVPDKDFIAALPGLRSRVAADVADLLGAQAANLFSQAFVATVISRRREIESEDSVLVLH